MKRRNFDKHGQNRPKHNDDPRAYYMPLPEGWENDKHMNVAQNGEKYTEQEKSIMGMLASDVGQVIIKMVERLPKEKTKAVAKTLNGGVLIRREKVEEPSEKELKALEEESCE